MPTNMRQDAYKYASICVQICVYMRTKSIKMCTNMRQDAYKYTSTCVQICVRMLKSAYKSASRCVQICVEMRTITLQHAYKYASGCVLICVKMIINHCGLRCVICVMLCQYVLFSVNLCNCASVFTLFRLSVLIRFNVRQFALINVN